MIVTRANMFKMHLKEKRHFLKRASFIIIITVPFQN